MTITVSERDLKALLDKGFLAAEGHTRQRRLHLTDSAREVLG